MDTDPRPLHLDLVTAAGGLLMAISGVLAATGHPLSRELLESLMGLIGAVAMVTGLVVGRIQARRARGQAPEHVVDAVHDAMDAIDAEASSDTPED